MMEIRSILKDEKAVSPVIGVILMVAITVILAAVIGALVMDIGSNPSSAPPSMSVDAEGEPGSEYTLTHAGGDVVNEDLSVRWTAAANGSTVSHTWGGPVEVGDSHTTSDNVSSDSKIRIVWTSEDGSEQHIISEVKVP